MDVVKKEHDRLFKRQKAAQGIQNVQSTIDLLQSARDVIAAGSYNYPCDLLWYCGGEGCVPGNFAILRQTTIRTTTDIVFELLDPNSAAVTLTKLQNPMKSSFDSINDNLKETHSGLNKYTKSLDKVPFTCTRPLDSFFV